jgi:hypothetical protein
MPRGRGATAPPHGISILVPLVQNLQESRSARNMYCGEPKQTSFLGGRRHSQAGEGAMKNDLTCIGHACSGNGPSVEPQSGSMT